MQDLNQNEIQHHNPIRNSYWGIIIAILIGCWLVGMGIVVAGWLISRNLAVNSSGQMNPGNQTTSQQNTNSSLESVDIKIPDDMPVLGNKDAKITMVEFADYQCPFCEQWEKTVYPELKSKYIDSGKVKFIYWDYPFLGDESFRASEASYCANDQGKYWEYHDALFTNQNGENEGAFADDKLIGFAKKLGLDSNKFSACLKADTHKAKVQDLSNQASKYGVISTPTVFVDGHGQEGVMPLSAYEKLFTEK